MKSIEKYLSITESYEMVSAKEAEELIEANDGNIVFIARETCPYCRKFVNKLDKAVKQANLTVYYLHSDDLDQIEEIAALREKYEIATVPSIIYSSESAGLRKKSDSSMTVDDILEMVEA